MHTTTRLLACLLLAVPLAASAQDRDFSKVEIKATKVAGSVWLLEGAGGNIAASIGDDGIALVDDQFAPLHPKIAAALAKLSSKPVRFVLNTHYHGDHTGGNAAFATGGATIIAQENVRPRLAAGRPEAKMPPAPPAALPVITFKDGLSLHWNGEEIRALHLRPGHTDGDVVLVFTKSNVVHLGDDFVTYGFPFIDTEGGGSVQGLIAALDELVPQLPADAKIIPGHGNVSTVADVKKFARSLEEMVAVVKKGLAAGKTVEQLQKENVLAPWAPWKNDFVPPEKFIATIARELQKR